MEKIIDTICALLKRMEHIPGSNNLVRNEVYVEVSTSRGLRAWVETSCRNEYGGCYPNYDGQYLWLSIEEYCTLLPVSGRTIAIVD